MIRTNFCWTIIGALSAVLAAPALAAAADPVPAAAPAPASQLRANMLNAGPVDFSGVWETAKLELVVLPEVAGKMTPEAQARADLFRKLADPVRDDPAKVCLIKGMPWTMLGRARNYPTEIVQYPDRIFMVFELYDQFRQIRLDGTAKPDDFGPSPSGWSTGRWEGQTLVVETTGLPVLNTFGVMQRTEEAKITERWQLGQHPEFGQVLEVDITVEDPEIFVGPARAHQVYKRSAPGVVPGGYNCSSALWDDHIAVRKAELKIEE